MRVGLDIDGLLDERPEFFAFLSAVLNDGGNFVFALKKWLSTSAPTKLF